MTDLDNLKNMLTKAGVVYEVSTNQALREIELTFQLGWMSEELSEELLFIFSESGDLKEVM